MTHWASWESVTRPARKTKLAVRTSVPYPPRLAQTVVCRAIERENLVAAELNARLMGNVSLLEAPELTALVAGPACTPCRRERSGRLSVKTCPAYASNFAICSREG
jgi:hypothetical protein